VAEQENTPRPAFDLQGHRGARGLHPENSLEGFRETLALGVTTLEMDLGLTRDDVLVVHHDSRLHPDIARGPDDEWIEPPTPALRDLTFSELQSFDLGRLRPGSSYAKRFPRQQGREGVRAPRLTDVIREAERICAGRIRYNVETKLTPAEPRLTASPAAFADAVVRILRASRVTSRAMVQSFDWRTLQRVRQLAPELETACLTNEDPDGDTIQRGRPGHSPWTAGLDVDDFDGSVPRLVQAAGCRVWSPRYRDLDAADLVIARKLGVRVIPWTVNEPKDIDEMLDLGIDGIISDRPDLVRIAMRTRAIPPPPACTGPEQGN
jgi:glycerophosphoryl diester phosphodiesterase